MAASTADPPKRAIISLKQKSSNFNQTVHIEKLSIFSEFWKNSLQ